jgi:glucosamine--fructose-6-phosphate aminotransferase (isomerizing)
VAATKTVIATLAAGLSLVAAWTENFSLAAALARLPDRLRSAATMDWRALEDMLRGTENLFTLGRGPGLGIAKEAALKLAEVAGITGIAHSAAEISHGPMALAGAKFPVLAFTQDDATRPGTEALLATLAASGVPVLCAGGSEAGAITLPALAADHPDTDLLPMLLSFYLAAEAAARARGRDPDHPPGLRKVTRTI